MAPWIFTGPLRRGSGAHHYRGVALADFRPTMDLGDGQVALDQPAERTTILVVTDEEIEGVFVLGEDEEFHLQIAGPAGAWVWWPPMLTLRG
jgi:hypothetical protein